MNVSSYAAIAGALNVLGFFITVGLLIWALVAVKGPHKGLIGAGLGLLTLNAVLGPVLNLIVGGAIRGGDLTPFLALEMLNMLVWAVGLGLVVLGAVKASQSSASGDDLLRPGASHGRPPASHQPWPPAQQPSSPQPGQTPPGPWGNG